VVAAPQKNDNRKLKVPASAEVASFNRHLCGPEHPKTKNHARMPRSHHPEPPRPESQAPRDDSTATLERSLVSLKMNQIRRPRLAGPQPAPAPRYRLATPNSGRLSPIKPKVRERGQNKVFSLVYSFGPSTGAGQRRALARPSHFLRRPPGLQGREVAAKNDLCKKCCTFGKTGEAR
jgi:hypothetical protein